MRLIGQHACVVGSGASSGESPPLGGDGRSGGVSSRRPARCAAASEPQREPERGDTRKSPRPARPYA
eukprot:scaffold39870_cov60-Phaeocystis_antarctica.AAC.2